jgi:hypothetical protein
VRFWRYVLRGRRRDLGRVFEVLVGEEVYFRIWPLSSGRRDFSARIFVGFSPRMT